MQIVVPTPIVYSPCDQLLSTRPGRRARGRRPAGFATDFSRFARESPTRRPKAGGACRVHRHYRDQPRASVGPGPTLVLAAFFGVRIYHVERAAADMLRNLKSHGCDRIAPA